MLVPIGLKRDIYTKLDIVEILAGGRKRGGYHPSSSVSKLGKHPLDIIAEKLKGGPCLGECKIDSQVEKRIDKYKTDNNIAEETPLKEIVEEMVDAGINLKSLIKQFKPEGPLDNSWLSNVHIEEVLARLVAIKEYKFVGFKCEMCNYEDVSINKNAPAMLGLNNVECEPGYCYGIICNTDSYPGSGEHWVAVFADLRDPNVWTAEFFNSGCYDVDEFIKLAKDWSIIMNKIKDKHKLDVEVKTVTVVQKQLQYDGSECGVFSLTYIIGRVIGLSSDMFNGDYKMPFQKINSMRKVLFA